MTIDMAPPAIEIAGLTKRFDRLSVLAGIDAVVARGRITALVGPNAAGKSTLLKCVLGLVRPDGGTIAIDGERVTADPAYRRAIGYMPQRAAFPENLTGDEAMTLLRGVRGRDAAIDFELIDRFGLGSELRKRVHTMSGGTRQKLNAVAAYLFRPSLLILDEPSAGRRHPPDHLTCAQRARGAGRRRAVRHRWRRTVQRLAERAQERDR
jgi:Cu-processing system ATP-binding protein